MDGRAPLSNAMDTPLHVKLLADATANVDGTADGGLGPCTMRRDDAIEVFLASTGSPPSFEARVGYDFSVVGGSDCADQLSASGGTYDALPCSLSYAAAGERQ
jgi:hypothetical protein